MVDHVLFLLQHVHERKDEEVAEVIIVSLGQGSQALEVDFEAQCFLRKTPKYQS